MNVNIIFIITRYPEAGYMGIRYTSAKLFDIRAVMARSQTGLGPGTGYYVNLYTTIGLLFGQFIWMACFEGLLIFLRKSRDHYNNI